MGDNLLGPESSRKLQDCAKRKMNLEASLTCSCKIEKNHKNMENYVYTERIGIGRNVNDLKRNGKDIISKKYNRDGYEYEKSK